MHPDVYRDQIMIAAKDPTGERMNLLARRLSDAEDAVTILRAKGYGASGMTIGCMVAQVPKAPRPAKARHE